MLPLHFTQTHLSRRPVLGAIGLTALLGTLPAQAQAAAKPDKV